MIQFEHVSKVFGKNQILKDVNFTIDQGNFVTIIGASGCGKTTTLKMINRLIKPTTGEIYIGGENIRDKDILQLRRSMGYVIQQVGLFPHMSILDNIAVVPDILGWPAEKQRERACELLDLIDMNPAEFAHRYPYQLSGGQQQRIGVLRALAADPAVILMDEPFGAVDPLTRTKLQQELKTLHTRLKKTILLVTHDIEEAFRLADRVLLMQGGQIVQLGVPAVFLEHPTTSFVREYIGGHRMQACR